MLEINFLNVNQGDSIVIHWEKNKGIGTLILDCNKTIEGNKTIQYIKDKLITEIDYVILSHPHFDHFSGMSELLDHCVSNNIKINHFLFTGKTQPEVIRKISKVTPSIISALNGLFDRLLDQSELGYLDLASLEASPFCDLKLNNELTLSVLAPTFKDEQKFMKSIKIGSFENSDVKNHPASNWLSTVLKIHTKDWYILLTSDAYNETLIGLDKRNLINDEKCQLKIAQSAHHGASNGHNITFWNKRNRASDTKIVFSVGTNTYGHPNDDVVKFFEENLFEIHSTNSIGLISAINSNKAIKNIIIHTNVFSSSSQNKNHSSNTTGDQRFVLDISGNFVS